MRLKFRPSFLRHHLRSLTLFCGLQPRHSRRFEAGRHRAASSAARRYSMIELIQQQRRGPERRREDQDHNYGSKPDRRVAMLTVGSLCPQTFWREPYLALAVHPITSSRCIRLPKAQRIVWPTEGCNRNADCRRRDERVTPARAHHGFSSPSI
jgi:hypothetical protein